MDLGILLSHLVEMKENHVCIYGCGKNGRKIIDFLESIDITIDNISDKNDNIKINGYKSITFEEMLSLNSKIVCIVTPAENVEYEYKELNEHFYTVLKMDIFVELMKYIPVKSKEWEFNNYVPFNHYESPYINQNSKENGYYERAVKNDIKCINLNEIGQKELLKNFGQYFKDFSYDISSHEFSRYVLNNGMFDETDALIYYSFLRKFKPKKVIEIGSGYSTALALDTRGKYMNEMEITCIEPFPNRLFSTMRENDKIDLKKDYVQEVDLNLFDNLNENDILFIDSSHVAKMGGDVPFEYFEILPRLKRGVLIHIHDIFYPFIYPKKWIKQGRCYNEAFILRALLMDNSSYEIMYFNDMMSKLYPSDFTQTGGSSIWLRKK